MEVEMFRSLPVVTKESRARKKIVDWKAVRQHFTGKVFTYTQLRDHVQKTYGKKKLYHSEIYRWIETLSKNNKVELRVDPEGVVFIGLNLSVKAAKSS